LTEADKQFGIRNYSEALLKFEEAIKAGEKNPMVHYKAGVCHQKSNDIAEQTKAIPYFEYGTQLVYTEQAVFFEDSDGPQLREQGWRSLFDALEKELAA
jgi:hypothetical protein